MSTLTAQDIVETWRTQLQEYFDHIKDIARTTGWNGMYKNTDITEDPFGIGANITYSAPVLILERPEAETKLSQQITFEPRHRNTIGSAGRIDVYSYPYMREALLLRILKPENAANLTMEEADQLVAAAPWRAYSQERMPLSADLTNDDGIRCFLEDLVAVD